MLVRCSSTAVDALMVAPGSGADLEITRIRLPFELSARQGRQAFLEWAEEHELPVRPIDWVRAPRLGADCAASVCSPAYLLN